jgi:hypothetical protein
MRQRGGGKREAGGCIEGVEGRWGGGGDDKEIRLGIHPLLLYLNRLPPTPGVGVPEVYYSNIYYIYINICIYIYICICIYIYIYVSFHSMCNERFG